MSPSCMHQVAAVSTAPLSFTNLGGSSASSHLCFQLEVGMAGYRAFCLFVAKHNPTAMTQRSFYDVEHLAPVRLDTAWLRSFYEMVCATST